MAFFSVRTKILASILLTTLLFGLGMVIFAETVIQQTLHMKLREKGVALAKRAAADCINPVITERYFEMTMMLKDLKNTDEDIVYAYVLSEDGHELAHTFDKGFPRDLLPARMTDLTRDYSTRDLSTDKGVVHEIAVPLLQGQIGVLHLGLSDAALKKDVNEIVMTIIAFSFAVLLVGTAASVWFSRSITKPLLKLTGAAEAFGRGEMDHQVSINSDDEVGELATVFNEMVEKRKEADAERELLIDELQEALKKVKTLSGLLPLCSSCKKIRDDRGYWNQIDAYISEHSDAEISHGICPDCAKKMYPEIWERMEREKEKQGS
jgi:methyl-accepting chemotaxis protein